MSDQKADNSKKGKRDWISTRNRLYEIVETGNDGDFFSRSYDITSTLVILLNLALSIALTFQSVQLHWGHFLNTLEFFTYLFFGIDYVLRILTAGSRYPNRPEWKALTGYLFSFMGIVDFLSFVPYFLPVFFPAGAVAFRMFRVVRIFRLFRINVYYDSLNVITEVLVSKKQQLLSSVFIILVLMLASSLCMYSLEHEAQPEVFQNAFSGIWWSVSTLLTVGYGDIYPITTLGRIFSIIITFLGVGMVAIPTGIISAGFVEQYSRAVRIREYGEENEVHFIEVSVTTHDGWQGKKIGELELPDGLVIAAIQRRNGVVVPRDHVILEQDDKVILGAMSFRDDIYVNLKRVVLRDHNPWIGELICDLDISRKTIIVMIQRGSEIVIPKGDLRLEEGDAVILYTQRRIRDAENLDV